MNMLSIVFSDYIDRLDNLCKGSCGASVFPFCFPRLKRWSRLEQAAQDFPKILKERERGIRRKKLAPKRAIILNSHTDIFISRISLLQVKNLKQRHNSTIPEVDPVCYI